MTRNHKYILVIAGAWVLTQAAGVQGRAEQFEVRDTKGRVRMKAFNGQDGQFGLLFLDGAGACQLSLLRRAYGAAKRGRYGS